MQAVETNFDYLSTEMVQLCRRVPLFRSVAWLTSPSRRYGKADSGRASVTDGTQDARLEFSPSVCR